MTTNPEPRRIRHASMSQVAQRAHQLHNAWLRGLNEGGHEVSASDIKAAFFAAITLADSEARKGKPR